jgi:plasmid stability protein
VTADHSDDLNCDGQPRRAFLGPRVTCHKPNMVRPIRCRCASRLRSPRADRLPENTSNQCGAIWYHISMAMTLRLPENLDAALRVAAAEDHRSVQQEVAHAIETYLALRETEEIKSDPETLRALAEARESVRSGDVVYGADAARALVKDHRAS